MDVEIIRPGAVAVHTPQTPKPTLTQYKALQRLFDHFNTSLIEPVFAVSLQNCLITLQRTSNNEGSFTSNRFTTLDGTATTDEIALNPKVFRIRSAREICQTLVHEMIHQLQHHYGKPMRNGYHDRQWGAAMKRVGLWPSSTGKIGGKETGHHMGDYVIEDGLFARSFEALDAVIEWGDTFAGTKEGPPPKPKQVKFTCPGCGWNYMAAATTAGMGACIPCRGIEMVAA